MTDREVLDRFDRSLVETYRQTIRNCGGEIWEANGMVSWASALPNASPAYANGVMRTTRLMSPREVVGISARFFGLRNHGYTLLARSDDRALWSEVERNGREMASERSAMIAIDVPPDPGSEDGVEVRPVEGASRIVDFCGVVASSLGSAGETGPVVDRILKRVENLRGPGRVGMIAYKDGMAASCALMALVEGTALVGWICTRPEYRRQGLATAVVGATARAGFERDADLAAVLSPPDLVPVLDSLGFEEVGRYREYLLP
ncbi:MAG: hypothetical protein J4G11_05510 [Acidimicrobiia bacterium]|nr:hypothetical protein [Acidimicrobiia bacterium]